MWSFMVTVCAMGCITYWGNFPDRLSCQDAMNAVPPAGHEYLVTLRETDKHPNIALWRSAGCAEVTRTESEADAYGKQTEEIWLGLAAPAPPQ